MFKPLITTLCLIAFPAFAIAQDMPTPSPEHSVLMKDVGQWTFTGKMITPDGFQEFKGEESVKTVGKFWTVSDYSSDVFGGLKGSATVGFDPTTKKFVGTWVDSFMPFPTKMTGTFDKETNMMTYMTTGIGMDGKPMPGKIVIHYKDSDHHTFKMMQKDPTGQSDKMVTTMEMTYTRKSTSAAK